MMETGTMKRAVVRRHQEASRRLWKERYGGVLICGFCGRLEGDDLAFHMDHVIQLSDGGADALWNLQPLCVDCHRLKRVIRGHHGIPQHRAKPGPAHAWTTWNPVFGSTHNVGFITTPDGRDTAYFECSTPACITRCGRTVWEASLDQARFLSTEKYWALGVACPECVAMMEFIVEREYTCHEIGEGDYLAACEERGTVVA